MSPSDVIMTCGLVSGSSTAVLVFLKGRQRGMGVAELLWAGFLAFAVVLELASVAALRVGLW